ncbi:MAG: 3-oxoadipate--succinyl-CoA transferase [candidate division NC10 bacterium]|nr:3-oxoadipate--succinyl-CoA transferase [candidate division NC10 bacterium]
MDPFGPPEIMAVAMARLLRDGELVFNGVGSILPMLAIELARRLYAPNLVYLNIGGGIDARPETLPLSSTDPSLLAGTAGIVDQPEFYQLVMRGGVDVMFLGAVQIDPAGRINSSVIGNLSRPTVRLPGGGGAAVILPTARRVILWRTKHDRRTFVEKLDFVTAAGNVDRVVTPLCVMRYQEPPTGASSGGFGRPIVESLHPGVTAEAVQANTGFPLPIPPGCPQTPPPTAEELAVIREFDPKNHRSLDFQ